MDEGLLAPETAEEKAYFDNQGVVEEKPAEEQKPDAEKPVEKPEKPEKSVDDEADGDDEQLKEQATVPYAAMKGERTRRQKAEAALRQKEADFERLVGRLEAMEAQMKPPVEEAPDPIRDLERLKKNEAEREAQERNRAAFQQMVGRYEAAAREFEQDNPDFVDAYKFMLQSRISELEAIGYPTDQARAVATNNEAEVVAMALNQGANPAERIYALAKARGYRKVEKKDPGEKIETIAKGQKASRSLSSVAGSPSKPNSLEALLDMSDDEFDAATKDGNWEKIWR